uniref:Prefoldin subunit 6 n=1 Tax=Sciurus vulgaris TaxID=55149 RepID=A0A8D2ARN5_SCIVU
GAAFEECCHFRRPGQKRETGLLPELETQRPHPAPSRLSSPPWLSLSKRSCREKWRNTNSYKKELALLDGSNVVFKLLGPVLVKQELGEARATVGKRLDYITAEIKRYETQLRDLERQSEQQRETLAQLQQEFQRAQAAKAGAPGKA